MYLSTFCVQSQPKINTPFSLQSLDAEAAIENYTSEFILIQWNLVWFWWPMCMWRFNRKLLQLLYECRTFCRFLIYATHLLAASSIESHHYHKWCRTQFTLTDKRIFTYFKSVLLYWISSKFLCFHFLCFLFDMSIVKCFYYSAILIFFY